MAKKKPVQKSVKKAVKKVIKKPVQKSAKKVTKKVVKRKPVAKILPKPIPKEIIVDSKKITDIEILENFLGNPNKVKLWKVFLLNTNREFFLKDLIKLTKIKKDNIILELRDMMRLGIVKASKKEHHIIYKTNIFFPLINEITEMVLSVVPRSSDKVLEKLNSLSKLKTVLLSGFFTTPLGKNKTFINSSNAGIDLLLVFEKIPENVENIISELEFNMGKELSYCALDQNDFRYRHSIGDKLIRDVLDFDHIVALDRLSFFK